MSVYYKEEAGHLRAAMDSMWTQSTPTDDFVLVCDGPLTPELEEVIEEMGRDHAESLNVIRLDKNGGLGNALNEGMRHCKNELIARMDSDDISRPYRCSKQLAIFNANPELGICSGIVEEFTEDTGSVEAKRVPPETNEKILRFARRRNPFNHPCVMYKKSAVEKAGGYQDFYLLEDYYLWIRMLNNGTVGYNIQEPLLWMRAGSDMYKRRAGLKYAQSQRRLFRYMRDIHFINSTEYLTSTAVRTVSSITPNCLREFMFKLLMRKRQSR
jgi:glycosyltransferase involved in cell wall biosynthesis